MANRTVWEYYTILTIGPADWQLEGDYKERLTKAGEQGWELVTAIPTSDAYEPLFIFKRPMAVKPATS